MSAPRKILNLETIGQRSIGILGLLVFVSLGTPCMALVDLNTNGMSDVWEAAYNSVGVAPDSDSDSDGLTALEESVAGTDPENPESVFRMQSLQTLESAYLLRWNSVPGKRYQAESTSSPADDIWTSQGGPVEGTGSEVLAAVPETDPPILALRIRLLTDNSAVINGRPYLQDVDTDLDGSPDIDEWAAGTNPFDAGSYLTIGDLAIGNAARLTWPSVVGKHYQVESKDSTTTGPWTPEGGGLQGTGAPMTATVEVTANSCQYRVSVTDSDSDSDTVSDWEEKMTGLAFGPYHYRTNFPTDPALITAIVSAPNTINIEPEVPVANASRQIPGSFVISRSGNLNALTVHYTVAGGALPGTHYQPLPGTITIPPGVHSVKIPVTPLGSAGLDPTRSVVLSLTPDPSYVPGTNTLAQVNVLKEVALSVTDFGAVGDGVTDDTLPIQATIDALEASATHNTLHFPAGVYRLNSPTFVSETSTSWHQLLELGKTDLANRDLIITGADGASLYSTTSPLRCRMLTARASFRSLWFHNMTWKKDGNPLSATTAEPNQADGVWVEYHDQRRVEAVGFLDCTFNNCHRAVSTSFHIGYDTRGLLKHFIFLRCIVLNPYGSNTIEAQRAFGGGQQVTVGPWIDNALFADSLFDGGTNGPVDPVKNPRGIRLDGSLYGSPLQLVFTNNVVRRMGIEAVLQSDEPFIGLTAAPLTFPPPDGTTPAQVLLYPVVSTFIPGQMLNFRTPLYTPGTPPGNAFMTVVSHDPVSRILTVTNPGLTPDIEGTVLAASRPIYLQDYNPTRALIADNMVLDGAPGGASGIVSMSQATIERNFIEGYNTGINLYELTKNLLNPPTPGTVLDSNVILTKNTATGGYAATGITSYGPGEIISDNLVVTPSSFRFVGVTVRGTNAWVEANTILPMVVVRNGYGNPARSVGIAFGNGTSHNTAAANSTYGMDVGIGPEQAFQPALHRVLSHHSTNDVLAIDPIGLVP